MARLLLVRGAAALAALLVPLTAFAAKPKAKPAPRTAAPSAAPLLTARQFYYGVYMRDAKLGFLEIQQKPDRYEGTPVVRTDSAMTMDMRVLGRPAQSKTTSTTWTDAKGKPVALQLRTEAAGRVTTVTAAFTENAVTYQADIMGTQKSDILLLGPGEQFLADTTSSAGLKPRPGLKRRGKVFNPQTLTLQTAEVVVVGQEPIAVGGQSVPAWKVIDTNPVATSTLYVTDSGELLRYDTVLGIQVRREHREQAIAPPTQQVDIAAAVGITPTGASLANPRALRAADYEITGATRALRVTNNNVQTARDAADPERPGRRIVRIAVRTGPLPSGPSVTRFAPDAPVRDDLKPYLASSLYVAADDPDFRTLSQRLIGGEKDMARAAAKLAAWVHRNMTPDPGIAAIRTAAEILRTRRGVCRDYTALFTALARAAGIPTRQCYGLAFFEGKFLYHAWPEVWVGGDTWVALEPTWGAPFADATHIRLAEGDISNVSTISQDIGRYEVKVIRAE